MNRDSRISCPMFIISASCLFMLIDCQTATEVLSGINVSSDGQYLLVENGTSESVFYFIIESECAARTEWVPSLSAPKIKSGDTAIVPFIEIINCRDVPVHNGDRIIVYIWIENFQNAVDVRNKIIIL